MATTDNKSIGYLLPDNPIADDFGCLIVVYPNRDEYINALWGSLSYLGTWVAWQREDTKSGTIAAQQWKEANDYTRDIMNCFPELITALTGIQQAIESIAEGGDNMVTINNQNNCCCCNGSGGGGGLPPAIIPPDGTPPDTLPPDPIQSPPNFPPSTPPTIGDETTQATQCAMASYLLFVFRSIALGMADRIYTSANIANALGQFYPGSGLSWGFAGGIARMALWVVSYIAMIGTAVSDIAREIDARSDALKCAMLNPDLSPDGRLAAMRVFIDLMALPFGTRFALKMLAGYININLVWDFGALSEAQPVLLDAGMFSPGCPPCVGPAPIQPPVYLPIDSDYAIIPFPLEVLTITANNQGVDLSYDEETRLFVHTPTNPGIGYHEATVGIDVDTLLSDGYDTLRGYIFEPIERGGDPAYANWKLTLSNAAGGSGELAVEPGYPMVYFQGDNTDVDYTGLIAQFDRALSYGNGPITAGSSKSGFRSDTYGGSPGWGNMSYRAWAIVKKNM